MCAKVNGIQTYRNLLIVLTYGVYLRDISTRDEGCHRGVWCCIAGSRLRKRRVLATSREVPHVCPEQQCPSQHVLQSHPAFMARPSYSLTPLALGCQDLMTVFLWRGEASLSHQPNSAFCQIRISRCRLPLIAIC